MDKLEIAKVQKFVRKPDHWKLPVAERYDIYELVLKGVNNQSILDQFYKLNRRSDASCYHKFASTGWQTIYSNWVNSEDYRKRSFDLYYENTIVD